ncbi:hypothetical protein BDW75DRAFT_230461 [Aspergillus navahoensis]
MRPSYLVLPIGLLFPRIVYCHEQRGLDVLEDVEAFVDLKYLVDLAASVASLIEDKGASPGNSQPADDSNLGPGLRKGVLLHDEDDPIIASDSSASLHPQCNDEGLPSESGNMLTPMADSMLYSDTDAGADAEDPRDIPKQFGSSGGEIKSHLGLNDQGGPSSAEPAPALDDRVAEGAGQAASSQSNKESQASAPVRSPVASVDILDGLEALGKLASLLQFESPSASKPPLFPAARKKARSMSTAELPLRQSPQRKPTQPPAQANILTRLEAMQRFSKLAKKLSMLTDESGPRSLPERIHHVISDPEMAPTVQWIFDNAGKVLTPEVFSAVKNFIRSSPLVPDKYRSFAVIFADSLGAVFDPKVAAHYQNVKTSFKWLSFDLISTPESLYRSMHWITATFHPSYIQTLSNRLALWRKAFTSPEMAGFLDVITDPANLDGISSSMGRVKQALTGERIHRLRMVFDDWGFSALNGDEYQAFGNVLGTKIKTHFATAEGISEVEDFLDVMESLLQSQSLHTLAAVVQRRAAVLTADFGEDLRSFFDEASSAAARMPGGLRDLRHLFNLIRPLLVPESRRERLPARVWAVARFIIDKVSSVQGSALEDMQGVLHAGLRVMHPRRVEELREVIADLQMGVILSDPLVPVSVGVGGNASVVPGIFEFSFTMLHTHPTPILGPDANCEAIQMLMQRLDARIAPGEVERTRETLQLLNSMSENLAYDALMDWAFSTWRDAFRPTSAECAQFGNGYALYPSISRLIVDEDFTSSSGSAQGSPSNGSRLSAKAEVFVPGAGAGAEAQDASLGESFHSTPTDTSLPSFNDIKYPVKPSPHPQSAVNFAGDPFASPRAPITGRWTPMYIDPSYPRMGGGLLCTLPAITAHANASSDSNSEAILAQHAPILLALVKDILRKHNPRSRTMIRMCTRQSYHLGEAYAVPTVLVTLDFEEDGSKAEAALPEILHLFRGKLGLIDVAIDIMDERLAEWMDDHLERAMELEGLFRALPGSRSSLGSWVSDHPEIAHASL